MTIVDPGFVHNTSPSFGKVPADLMHNQALTDGAVRLYAHMKWRYGQKHENYEGMKSISEYMGVGEKTIAKRIKELERYDWVIVIERGENKHGHFSTHFYHVFEVQEDCRKFRLNPIVEVGDKMREKPEVLKSRASRKGIGGNPKWVKGVSLADRQNSSSDGENPGKIDEDETRQPIDHQNSSSDDHQNSSSDKLDTSLSREKIYTSGDVPVVEEEKIVPKVDFEGMRKAVSDVFGIEGRNQNHIVHMMLGSSTTDGYKQYNFKIPATPKEIYDFRPWYRREYPTQKMVQRKGQIDDYFGRFRKWKENNPEQQSNGSTTRFYDVTPPDDWYIPRQEFDVFHPVKKIRIGKATTVEEMEQVIKAYDAQEGAA